MTQQLAKKVAKNSLINVFASGLSRLSRFVFFILLARLLGARDFGFFSIAFSLFMIIETFCALGSYNAFQRFVPDYLEKNLSGFAKGLLIFAFWTSLILSGLMVLSVTIAPNRVVALLGQDPQLASYLVPVFIGLPFYLLIELIVGLAMSRGQFGIKACLYSIRFLSMLCLLGILAGWGYKSQTLLWAFGVGAAMAALLALIFLPALVRNIWKSRSQYEYRAWFKFLCPVICTSLFVILASELDRVFLGMMRSAQEAGIYNVASRVIFQVNIINSSLSEAFLPEMTRLFHSGLMAELKALYQRVSHWCLVLYLPLQLLLIVFSQEILGIFGRDFQEGAVILLPMTLIPAIIACLGPSYYLLRMANRQKIESLIQMVSYATIPLLDFLLIPRFGMIGAVIAVAIGSITMVIWAGIQLYCYLGIHALNRSLLGPVVLTVALLSLALPLKHISLWAAGVLIVGGYCSFLYLFLMNQQDKEIIHMIFNKFAMIKWIASSTK